MVCILLGVVLGCERIQFECECSFQIWRFTAYCRSINVNYLDVAFCPRMYNISIYCGLCTSQERQDRVKHNDRQKTRDCWSWRRRNVQIKKYICKVTIPVWTQPLWTSPPSVFQGTGDVPVHRLTPKMSMVEKLDNESGLSQSPTVCE